MYEEILGSEKENDVNIWMLKVHVFSLVAHTMRIVYVAIMQKCT